MIREAKQSVLRFLGYHALGSVASLLCGSLRTQRRNNEIFDEYVRQNKRFILAFWHGTMLYPWYYHRGKKFLGLTSQSKDGEILARILRKWGYTVTRGSSSKGGKVALGIMTDFAKFEGSVLITPDGPRGPVMEFKPGAVVAALRASVPLFLVGVGYQNKRHLKSWDKFSVPSFFSRVNLIYSDPVFVTKELSKEDVDKVIKKCSDELNRLTKEAGVFE
ncbi:MAG: hypothetical protein AMXMBFR48_04270 [Ignavibacteriales bacterium]